MAAASSYAPTASTAPSAPRSPSPSTPTSPRPPSSSAAPPLSTTASPSPTPTPTPAPPSPSSSSAPPFPPSPPASPPSALLRETSSSSSPPNSLHFLVCFLAVLSLGAIATTANPLYTVAELSKQAKDCRPKLVITVPSSGPRSPAWASPPSSLAPKARLYPPPPTSDPHHLLLRIDRRACEFGVHTASHPADRCGGAPLLFRHHRREQGGHPDAQELHLRCSRGDRRSGAA